MTPEDDERATRERYALGPRGKRVTVEAALERAERAEAEASTLRSERAEAVAALRRLIGASRMLLGRFQRMHDNDVLREVNERPTEEALDCAELVLARYPEGKR